MGNWFIYDDENKDVLVFTVTKKTAKFLKRAMEDYLGLCERDQENERNIERRLTLWLCGELNEYPEEGENGEG